MSTFTRRRPIRRTDSRSTSNRIPLRGSLSTWASSAAAMSRRTRSSTPIRSGLETGCCPAAQRREHARGHRHAARLAAQPAHGLELRLDPSVEPAAAQHRLGAARGGPQRAHQLVLEVLHRLRLRPERELQAVARVVQAAECVVQMAVEPELVADDLVDLRGVRGDGGGRPRRLEHAEHPLPDARSGCRSASPRRRPPVAAAGVGGGPAPSARRAGTARPRPRRPCARRGQARWRRPPGRSDRPRRRRTRARRRT